jgi:TonB family protein
VVQTPFAYHAVVRRALVSTVVVLLLTLSARSDEWYMPERQSFTSTDGRWRLVVTPGHIDSQLAYFTDKVNEVPATPDNRARGALYRKRAIGWKLMHRWTLVNEISPVSALVANDGTVVTFDNWHGMGYGDDVIVIYAANGELVRKLGLSDLMDEADILQLPHSTSSIQWAKTYRIDEQRHNVVLQVAAHQTEELPVSLATGEVLVAKHLMFPRPKVTWSGDDVAAATCDDAEAIAAEELVQRATVAPVPAYPEVARKARVGGTVIMEITVDENGNVERVTMVKPLPFGIDKAASAAVRAWQFRPLERNGERVKMCGRVRMIFDLTKF